MTTDRTARSKKATRRCPPKIISVSFPLRSSLRRPTNATPRPYGAVGGLAFEPVVLLSLWFAGSNTHSLLARCDTGAAQSRRLRRFDLSQEENDLRQEENSLLKLPTDSHFSVSVDSPHPISEYLC